MFKSSLHPMTFLILNIIFVIIMIFTHNYVLNITIILLTIINNIINKKIKLKYIVQILVMLSPLLLTYYITASIFSSKLTIYQIIEMSTRIIAITLTSIVSVLQVNFEDLLHYLMRKYKLPVSLGYSLITAINAINHLINEFNQLKLAYQIRYAKNINYLKIIPNLFINAAKFAYYNGISLSSRNLHPNKTYIRPLLELKIIDYIIIAINFITILSIIIIFR